MTTLTSPQNGYGDWVIVVTSKGKELDGDCIIVHVESWAHFDRLSLKSSNSEHEKVMTRLEYLCVWTPLLKK